jgi:hypothetical protein
MHPLIFIRDRILSPARMHLPPAMTGSPRRTVSAHRLSATYIPSSESLLGLISWPLAGFDRLAMATSQAAPHAAVARANSQRSAVGALISITARRIDSNITG